MRENLKNRRGRPPKEDSKSEKFLLKLTPDERSDLDYLSSITEESKSEILRKAFRAYYNLKTHSY